MIVPETNLRPARMAAASLAPPRRHFLWLAAAVFLLVSVFWTRSVYNRIQWYAHHDQARPAAAIAVFGAAEYDGRPSPVLRARLDHALHLYQRGLAPLVITLGGGYPADDQHSEGGVGAAYLIAHGVPPQNIIAETESDDTEESAARLANIARENNLRTIIAVSDGTHLFRIHAICTRDGLNVYTSPRSPGHDVVISWQTRAQRIAHEILSYTAWRLHLH